MQLAATEASESMAWSAWQLHHVHADNIMQHHPALVWGWRGLQVNQNRQIRIGHELAWHHASLPVGLNGVYDLVVQVQRVPIYTEEHALQMQEE